jgi:hemerythrin superfamily protein
MSFLDKIASSIMPPESAEDRANARRVAESKTSGGDWLAVVLDQHRQIEGLFERALTSTGGSVRQSAVRELATLLTGHANAEETVLYPALADAGGKSHATMAYEEQAMTKVQLAKLEKLDPMSEEWREKLEHIRGAVMHHVYQEEGTWFPELQQNVPANERTMLTRRFLEEFQRYAGTERSEPPLQMAAQMNDAPSGGSTAQ